MPNNDEKTLHTLLCWLAAYVIVLVTVVAFAGKLVDAIPVLTNLISAFAGAAFAIMRAHGNDPK